MAETTDAKRKNKSSGWANLSYKTRVTISFAAIAAMALLVAIVVLSFTWNEQFYTYARQNAQSVSDATASRVAQSYQESGNRWSEEAILSATYVAEAYQGSAVMVVNAAGTVLYDSTTVKKKGVAAGPAAEASETETTALPTSSALAVSSNVVVNDMVVGQVRIWTVGSDAFLRKSDETFRDNSYQAMAVASFIAIALATMFGFVFARNLVRPIERMTKTAKAIKEGDLSARTGMHGEDEIARLGQTFDAMAASVEKDRELERRLTTDVAHELRTPLMAIQATVEAMIDGVFEPNEERLETVNSEVQRLGRLVDALLKLSRLENRSTPLELKTLNVGNLVQDIVTSHEAFVIDSGLEMKFEAQEDTFIKGDKDLISQATANLISNAVRYTPEGGSITVRVTHGEIMANIIVEDTGIGLSPEEARMVFSRFWRADAGRTRESGGLGIGLAVVKEIVDRHGGWCQAEGTKGEGSRFTLHIPLYDERVESAENKSKVKAKTRVKISAPVMKHR